MEDEFPLKIGDFQGPTVDLPEGNNCVYGVYGMIVVGVYGMIVVLRSRISSPNTKTTFNGLVSRSLPRPGSCVTKV